MYGKTLDWRTYTDNKIGCTSWEKCTKYMSLLAKIAKCQTPINPYKQQKHVGSSTVTNIRSG